MAASRVLGSTPRWQSFDGDTPLLTSSEWISTVRTSPGSPAAVLLVIGLSLTACGADDSPAADPASSPSSSPARSSTTSDEGPVIDVVIAGDTVTPNGDRVPVEKGDDVILHVSADVAGEIHVHSSPEQELEYDAGSTTLTITGLDQPGVVDVESHTLEKVIVQLEVS